MLSEIPECQVCRIQCRLYCQGCVVVHYCSKDHQEQDRQRHKQACNAIKKAKKTLDREDTKLRNIDPAAEFEPDAFEEIGNWWKILSTRPYLRACFGVVEALLKVKAYAAVKAAHEQLMECLRLCRGDNLGVRYLIPAVKIRLGLDQNCYDFVKWYLTAGEDPKYDWNDMDLPFLNLEGENAFEKLPANATNKFCNINNTAGLLLLNVRMKLGLRSLQQASMVAGSRVPQETLENVVQKLNLSDIITRNPSLMNAQDLGPWISKVDGHIDALLDGTLTQTREFWKLMFNPGNHLTARPAFTSHGSLEEAQLALQYSYDSWNETPGALELIKEQLQSRRIRV